MLRRTGPLFAVVLSFALATQLACNDDDDSDDGAGDDAADDAADDDDDGAPADDGDDDGAVDNVAACEDFIAEFDCNTLDLSMYLMCDLYAQTTCDIADYFDCLADEATCDAAAFSTAATNCASLATCG